MHDPMSKVYVGCYTRIGQLWAQSEQSEFFADLKQYFKWCNGFLFLSSWLGTITKRALQGRIACIYEQVNIAFLLEAKNIGFFCNCVRRFLEAFLRRLCPTIFISGAMGEYVVGMQPLAMALVVLYSPTYFFFSPSCFSFK